MNRTTVVVCAALILALVSAEVASEKPNPKVPKPYKHKPKKVKCKDKNFSKCYHKDLLCPASCPRNCSVDCNSCQAVCTPVPPLPPTPPKVQKPKQAKCKDKRFATCYNKKLLCPASCPRTCNVDCATCQPVCGAVHTPPLPPTPSPPSSSGPKQVRCKNKNYPACYFRQFTCPAACPETCEVNCVTCSPICSKFIYNSNE